MTKQETRMTELDADAAPPGGAAPPTDPFAHFARMFDAKPLGGRLLPDDHVIYAIHTGTEWEARLTVGDLRRRLAAPPDAGRDAGPNEITEEELGGPGCVDGTDNSGAVNWRPWPDAGRDAGGAPSGPRTICRPGAPPAWGAPNAFAQLAPYIRHEVGCSWGMGSEGGCNCGAAKALDAYLRGGRPAAEPPDVREAVAKVIWGYYGGAMDWPNARPVDRGYCLQTAEAVLAALGAAPPTPDCYACGHAESEHSRPDGDCWRCHCDAFMGAPAEPGAAPPTQEGATDAKV